MSVSNVGMSVIICSHNGAERLKSTLQFLQSQKVQEDLNWEVIIVDNASTDGTGKWAREIWTSDIPLKIIFEPRLGAANARISGLRQAKYEYIGLIDDDNWVDVNWVQSAFDLIHSLEDVGAIGSRSTACFEEDPPWWFESCKNAYAVGEQADREGLLPVGRCLWTAGMVLRRKAWEGLEKVDFTPLLKGRHGRWYKYTAGEDNEISLMLQIQGWKLYYSPKLQFQHFMPASRLKWNILSRMMRGVGKAKVTLGIYHSILNNKNGFAFRPRTGWMGRIIDNIISVLEKPKDLLLAVFEKGEGSQEVLEMQMMLGRLEERLFLLNKVDQLEFDLRKKYFGG